MIWFDVDDKGATLNYEPERSDDNWVARELRSSGAVTITRVFCFQSGDLLTNNDSVEGDDEGRDPAGDFTDFGDVESTLYRFRFATTNHGYHHIPGRILGIENDVLIIAEGISLDRYIFAAERNIGIFRRIAKLKQDGGAIIVGGEMEGNIPLGAFQELLKRFP